MFMLPLSTIGTKLWLEMPAVSSASGVAAVPFGENENGIVGTTHAGPAPADDTRNSSVCQPVFGLPATWFAPGPRYNTYVLRRSLPLFWSLLAEKEGAGRLLFAKVDVGITPSIRSWNDCRMLAKNDTMPSSS